MMGAMGQLIAFPGKHEPKVTLTDDRRHAFITGLCALTFLLGFFIIGPSLAIFAFGFATTTHIASCAMCIAGLAVTWAITRVAYKHL
jgi:hypothetical protein